MSKDDSELEAVAALDGLFAAGCTVCGAQWHALFFHAEPDDASIYSCGFRQDGGHCASRVHRAVAAWSTHDLDKYLGGEEHSAPGSPGGYRHWTVCDEHSDKQPKGHAHIVQDAPVESATKIIAVMRHLGTLR